MTALLEFANLAVTRGDRVVLRDLSGRLDRGEVLHIRGPNGAGKTSLLEILSGLRPAGGGTLVRRFEAGTCHWVGHRNGLSLSLTPFENLRFWCAVQDAPDDGVRGALREFGLTGVSDRECRQLSAGQRRRTALARLAVVRRPVWFLDEPLSGLDADGSERWAGVLGEHLQHGGAAIVTSHQALPLSVPSLRTWDLG